MKYKVNFVLISFRSAAVRHTIVAVWIGKSDECGRKAKTIHTRFQIFPSQHTARHCAHILLQHIFHPRGIRHATVLASSVTQCVANTEFIGEPSHIRTRNAACVCGGRDDDYDGSSSVFTVAVESVRKDNILTGESDWFGHMHFHCVCLSANVAVCPYPFDGARYVLHVYASRTDGKHGTRQASKHSPHIAQNTFAQHKRAHTRYIVTRYMKVYSSTLVYGTETLSDMVCFGGAIILCLRPVHIHTFRHRMPSWKVTRTFSCLFNSKLKQNKFIRNRFAFVILPFSPSAFLCWWIESEWIFAECIFHFCWVATFA